MEYQDKNFILFVTAERESTPLKYDKYQEENSNRFIFHKFHSRRESQNVCDIEDSSEESTEAKVEEHINLQRIRCVDVVEKKSFSIISTNSTSSEINIRSIPRENNGLPGQIPIPSGNHNCENTNDHGNLEDMTSYSST